MQRMHIMVTAVAAITLFSFCALSAEYAATEIQATDGKISCLSRKDWIITVVSGPCEKFSAPAKIAIGETFDANGKTRTIGIIQATQAEKDMKGYGLDIKKENGLAWLRKRRTTLILNQIIVPYGSTFAPASQ